MRTLSVIVHGKITQVIELDPRDDRGVHIQTAGGVGGVDLLVGPEDARDLFRGDAQELADAARALLRLAPSEPDLRLLFVRANAAPAEREAAFERFRGWQDAIDALQLALRVDQLPAGLPR